MAKIQGKAPVKNSGKGPAPVSGATQKKSTARTTIRQRRNRDVDDYDMSAHGDTQSGQLFDRCFVREEASKLKIVRPGWNAKLPLVFKPTPAVDPQTGDDFLPGRKSADDNAFTDWLRVVPGIKYVGLGDNTLTCLTYDKRWLRKGYDPATDNPYFVLHKALVEATGINKRNNKEEPKAMLGGRNVLTAKWLNIVKNMCRPKTHFGFLQGAVFQNGDDVYVAGKNPPLGFRDDDRSVIIELQSSSAVEALKKIFNARVTGATADDSVDAQFIAGDPVDLKTGQLLCVYNPSKKDGQTPKVDFLLGQGQDAASAVQDESEEEDVEYSEPGDDDDSKGGFVGWAAVATPTMYYLNKFHKRKKIGCDISQYEERVRANYQWWDDILYVPETPELALWLAKVFAAMPNLLLFAWQDNPEFLTGDVKGVLNSRVVIPGAALPGSKKKSQQRDPVPQDDEDDDDTMDADDDDSDDADVDVVDSDTDDAGDIDAEDSLADIDDVDQIDDDAATEELDESEDGDEDASDEDSDVGEEDDAQELAGFEDDDTGDEDVDTDSEDEADAEARAKAERLAAKRAAQRREAVNTRADTETATMAKKKPGKKSGKKKTK